MKPGALLASDGSLIGPAVELLHAVSGVDRSLLRAARIRPSRSNWLHAPWYARHRGGAITVGRTIWFTSNWYAPNGLGDGSLRSTYAWLLHLSHEVGHLPQAERFGRSLWGKARYVAAFSWQYASRALLLKRPVHDGSRLELEADRGRKVLLEITRETGERHPVIIAVHEQRHGQVLEWCTAWHARLAQLKQVHAEESA
ncbi:MAG: hypothetical protein KBH07_10400 [Flavobacteriales bacterium]|nr:hypothetical protein [Flavobacteriales bacterium]MBP9080241.1 hypothetical protein [Flavobacteriales bacterium]